ncbi:unnamed protein product, partial [Prorocentrum cordatum]
RPRWTRARATSWLALPTCSRRCRAQPTGPRTRSGSSSTLWRRPRRRRTTRSL